MWRVHYRISSGADWVLLSVCQGYSCKKLAEKSMRYLYSTNADSNIQLRVRWVP